MVYESSMREIQMKLKEKWACEYRDECFRNSNRETDIQAAWLYGFDFAKAEILKSLEKDYEWDREEIENIGEIEVPWLLND